jgi:hypothetical protein
MIVNAEAKKLECTYLFISCLCATFKRITNGGRFYFTDHLCIKINCFANTISS